MPRSLVIVESPAKARTIAGMLGPDFMVESSMGHVRDLPPRAADIPPAYRSEPWARDGVDTENDFKPLYVVTKKDQVRKLKGLLKDADELYLATDEDREGESIAWHLLQELTPRIRVRRMVFHEITPDAIQRAIDEPRDIDERLVDAQETRRILDRLYGYRLSEVLWRKSTGRSAGRVQSAATRLLVERERERMAFRSATWWDIEGTFAAADTSFTAGLVAVDGTRLATGKDFGSDGRLARDDVVLLDGDRAAALVQQLSGREVAVRSVEERPYRKSPPPPFITSTLQQAANNRLGMTARRTMAAAQRLYENGYITYMRTDSTTLSETALAAARGEIARLFGQEYVPPGPRTYQKKVKNAQEAHEAIRPAGDRFRHPGEVAREVGADESRIYELVWQRTLASQMPDATGQTVTVRLGATAADGTDAEFSASGTVVTFAGYQRVYDEAAEEPEGDQQRRLPPLAQGDQVEARSLEAKDHTTQPPARYTEATLVRRLEELGIGRPSTYASIIDTILDPSRGYAFKRGRALVPTFTAFAIVQLLERHFEQYVDYGFTASMEDDLDRIANGEEERVPWLRRFYFGNGAPGLRGLVSEERLASIDPAEVNRIPIATDADGEPIVVRVGRYGPFLQRGDDRASLPDDLAPDELTRERAVELLTAPSGDRQLGVDPETGLGVYARAGRYGPYVQLGEAEGKTKPRTASLFKDMDLETVSLEQALRLLSLPRVVGVDPSDGEEVLAQNGRYGPYLKKGSETRSLESEDRIFTITLDEALDVLAQPRTRRGQRSAQPLRELGEDPATGRPVVVKEGRYGPYVTDGETNASLRTGDLVEDITIQRAAELLAERRAKGPATGRRGAKRAGKKAAAKKAGAKKAAAKKAGAKKAGAKKAAGAGPDGAQESESEAG